MSAVTPGIDPTVSEATADAPKNSETDDGMEKASTVKQTKNARHNKKKSKGGV